MVLWEALQKGHLLLTCQTKHVKSTAIFQLHVKRQTKKICLPPVTRLFKPPLLLRETFYVVRGSEGWSYGVIFAHTIALNVPVSSACSWFLMHHVVVIVVVVRAGCQSASFEAPQE